MSAMREAFLVLLPVLVLGACAATTRQGVPYYRIPAGPSEPATAASRPIVPRSGLTGIPSAATFGLVIGRSAPGEYGRAPAAVAPTPTLPAAVPPANPGPLTGYGIGGMQQMPGAPPNPPYTGSGLGPPH
jgi:hypothetical protein